MSKFRPKILCVDDETLNLSLLEAILLPRGYDVVTAANGLEALEKFKTETIDLCILDVNMPGIDGFEVCRRIKADEEHRVIPVVMVTAHTDNENRIRGIEAGADDYISKPFNTAEVLARLKMLLHVKSLQDSLRDAGEYAENIVETVRQPLLVLDSELKILTANLCFYETFRVNPEETIGNFIYDLGNRQWDIATLRTLLEEILPHATMFNGYEVAHDFKGIGRKVFILNARQIFRNNIGSDIILLAMEDITDRKLAEKLHEDIERITCHDLKTPLNAIINIPDILLMESNLPPEQIEWVQLIKSSGHRMLNIIDSSLSLYKIEQGTYEIAPVLFNLLPLITDIAKESAQDFTNKRIKLLQCFNGCSVEAGDVFILNAELMLCYTMLSNLIKNALEASPPDEVITVSFAQDDRWSFIDIHNMGAIPEEIRTGFFDKYVTCGKKRGTGLGTYSALLAARTHHGDISMQTSENTGTLISIRLPKTF
jgi:DNA-binding response OmpR family regulator